MIFGSPSLTIPIIFGAFSFKNWCFFGEIKSLWIEVGMFSGCFLGQRCHVEESWKWFYKKYKWGKKLLNMGEKTSVVKCHYWGRRIMESKPWLFFCSNIPYIGHGGRSQKFFTPSHEKFFTPRSVREEFESMRIIMDIHFLCEKNLSVSWYHK